MVFISDAYHRQSTWMKRGPRAFYASLTVITHTDLRTLKCCQCHMWNRYHPWNWAQNNQLTNPREEEATWPSTGEKHGPWGDFMKRLVASGPGTDDGVEKRTRVGGFMARLAVHASRAAAEKKKRGNLWCHFWHAFDFWLEHWLFRRPRSQLVNRAANLCKCKISWI